MQAFYCYASAAPIVAKACQSKKLFWIWPKRNHFSIFAAYIKTTIRFFMKLKFVAIVILCCLLVACQKEVSVENGFTPTNPGGGGGGVSTVDCKSCTYLPLCSGSWFKYADTLQGGAITNETTDTSTLVKDTTISGKIFQKFRTSLQGTFTYYNCTAGESNLITYNATTSGGGTVQKAEILPLKANAAVGATWSYFLTNPAGQQVEYKNTMEAKGISKTVNGRTYPDVIHVSTIVSINVPILGNVTTNEADYYYAKGVGLIEYETTDPFLGTVIQKRALVNYFIP
jgi:hypothetical protein